MNERKVLKHVVKFATREFTEKKPMSVRVLRRKRETFFTRGGPLKAISIGKTEDPYFLVALDYAHALRIYYFSKKGIFLGGQNFDTSSEFLRELKKSTITEFKLPKKIR